MEYEVTVKMRVKSRFSAERVQYLVAASFEYGTPREAIGEGAKLDADPNCVRVTVCKAHGDPYRQVQDAAQR